MRGWTACAGAAASLAILAAGCTIPSGGSARTSTITSTVTVEPAPELQTGDWARAVDAVEQDTGAVVAVAWSDGGVAGSLSDVTAWSTIKVPLSIAAARLHPGTQPSIDAAIMRSDNDAARQLWEHLGGGEQAAQAVEAVLREAGDPTEVQPFVTRPEFSAFGQTQWGFVEQAQFASHLPELEASDAVLAPMQAIDPSQAYGLGRLPGVAFKGGWGPDTQGRYVVRQFGVVDGRGVAIAAMAPDGTYESAQVILDRLASEVVAPQVGVW
ncbi:hypothetical protein CUTER_01530 [Corynebacterium uterequi]|uniref:Beta-lactamase class A n=1 Tax=Corynebacterium uterequi TaxID=1072256 RepID=A0A0G3HGR1_9CORY|nr:hypothetical protein CUTER_01530 [Corynebacterium uterequi]